MTIYTKRDDAWVRVRYADDVPSGNAKQRRENKRIIKGNHFRWPLGTTVIVLGGHHSPEAVGLKGKVNKHGFPCGNDECMVEFDHAVTDVTFKAEGDREPTARFCHYVKFKHLRKVKQNDLTNLQRDAEANSASKLQQAGLGPNEDLRDGLPAGKLRQSEGG